MTTPAQFQTDALRQAERLHRILEATTLLNSTLDLPMLTRIILQIVRDEVGIERGTVFVLDRERKQLRSFIAQEVESYEICLPMGRGIAGAVAETGEPIDIPDAYEDPRFDSQFDQVLGYRTRDIFCMPILNREGTTVGVLELLNRMRPFTDQDREFLSGISVHVGLALENAWLHREILAKKKIEQELSLARDIQRNFYPNLPEVYGGVEIYGSSEMCEAVGGDYFDFVDLRDGKFIVMVGDVSGKGVGAALLMTSLHATCRALVRHVHSLERITFSLNEVLRDTTRGQNFVTLLLALVDPAQGKLHYIRAGHNPPFCVSPSGECSLLAEGGGPPLGLFPTMTYKREIINVEPGSAVVIYTDGVTEAENNTGADFGVERLNQVVQSRLKQSARDIHQEIRLSLQEFIRDTPAHDDSTLIVLKF